MAIQLLANAIALASTIFILASGFALIYRLTHCLHFTHAVVFTCGAYFAFVCHKSLDIPLFPSLLVAVTCAACLGAGLEIGVYRPLRRKGSSSLCVILASLGAYVALENAVSLCFGDDVKSIRSSSVEEGIVLCGARVTPWQIAICCSALFVFVALQLVLEKTRFGKAVRAMASDRELASTAGVEADRVTLATFVIGSALAGVSGVLVALDVNMTPGMGLNPFLLGVVAVVVGGIRSLPGIAIGALLLAMAQSAAAWRFGSQWQNTIAFFILLAFLLARPEGVMGKKLRKAAA